MNQQSEEIADGVSSGMARSRTHINDRRLLVIYLLLLVASTFLFYRSNQQTSQIRHAQQVAKQAAFTNCQLINTGNAKVNKVLGQLITNAENSTGLTPPQKTKAIQTYHDLQLPITDCTVFK